MRQSRKATSHTVGHFATNLVHDPHRPQSYATDQHCKHFCAQNACNCKKRWSQYENVGGALFGVESTPYIPHLPHTTILSANKHCGVSKSGVGVIGEYNGIRYPVSQQLGVEEETKNLQQPRKNKLKQVVTGSTIYDREQHSINHNTQQVFTDLFFGGKGERSCTNKKIHFSQILAQNYSKPQTNVCGIQIIEPSNNFKPTRPLVNDFIARPKQRNLPFVRDEAQNTNAKTKHTYNNNANLYKNSNKKNKVAQNNNNSAKPNILNHNLPNTKQVENRERLTSKCSHNNNRLLAALTGAPLTPLHVYVSTPTAEGIISCATYYSEIKANVWTNMSEKRESRKFCTSRAQKSLISGEVTHDEIDAYIKRVQKALKRKTKNDLRNVRKGNVFDHLGEWSELDPRDPQLRVEVYDRAAIRRMISGDGVQN